MAVTRLAATSPKKLHFVIKRIFVDSVEPTLLLEIRLHGSRNDYCQI